MSARSFRSISMAAGVAVAALGCYMVSLRVAAERATLEGVETRIVVAQRDIRMLQTEIGTRGRLAQLEKWNTKVLALSAPDENQFLQGSFQLATLARPRDKVVDPAAPVVLASAPAPQRAAPGDQSDSADARPGVAPSDMMHVASFKTDTTEAAPPKRVTLTASAPVVLTSPKKAVEKTPAKAAAKPSTVAGGDADPLAPQPAKAKPKAIKTAVSTPDKLAAASPTHSAAPATKDAKAKK